MRKPRARRTALNTIRRARWSRHWLQPSCEGVQFLCGVPHQVVDRADSLPVIASFHDRLRSDSLGERRSHKPVEGGSTPLVATTSRRGLKVGRLFREQGIRSGSIPTVSTTRRESWVTDEAYTLVLLGPIPSLATTRFCSSKVEQSPDKRPEIGFDSLQEHCGRCRSSRGAAL